MMAIRDLQRRLQEVGRIRLGPSMQGRRYPDKLSTFRFTSPHKHLIEEIAAVYGGDSQPWNNQHEVITRSDSVPVYVPPQQLDPWYEQWGNGVCTRRCDGYRDIIHDTGCTCDPDERDCKPVIRLNVMLADVPGLGVWRLETHGMNAVSRLANLDMVLARVSVPLPARLILQIETRKFFNREEKKVEKREFPVPGLLFDQVTARQIQAGGDALSRAIQGTETVEQQAIASSTQPEAPAQPPTEQEQSPRFSSHGGAVDPDVVKKQIDNATDPEQIRTIWRDAKRSGWLTEGLKTLLTQRAEKLSAQLRQQQAAAQEAKPPAQSTIQPEDPFAAVDPVPEDPFDNPQRVAVRESSYAPDAEVVHLPEPAADPIDYGTQPDPWPSGPPETPTTPAIDKGQVWMEIMQAAGQRKWDSSRLSSEMHQSIGAETPAAATAEELVQFRDELRSGD